MIEKDIITFFHTTWFNDYVNIDEFKTILNILNIK